MFSYRLDDSSLKAQLIEKIKQFTPNFLEKMAFPAPLIQALAEPYPDLFTIYTLLKQHDSIFLKISFKFLFESPLYTVFQTFHEDKECFNLLSRANSGDQVYELSSFFALMQEKNATFFCTELNAMNIDSQGLHELFKYPYYTNRLISRDFQENENTFKYYVRLAGKLKQYNQRQLESLACIYKDLGYLLNNELHELLSESVRRFPNYDLYYLTRLIINRELLSSFLKNIILKEHPGEDFGRRWFFEPGHTQILAKAIKFLHLHKILSLENIACFDPDYGQCYSDTFWNQLELIKIYKLDLVKLLGTSPDALKRIVQQCNCEKLYVPNGAFYLASLSILSANSVLDSNKFIEVSNEFYLQSHRRPVTKKESVQLFLKMINKIDWLDCLNQYSDPLFKHSIINVFDIIWDFVDIFCKHDIELSLNNLEMIMTSPAFLANPYKTYSFVSYQLIYYPVNLKNICFLLNSSCSEELNQSFMENPAAREASRRHKTKEYQASQQAQEDFDLLIAQDKIRNSKTPDSILPLSFFGEKPGQTGSLSNPYSATSNLGPG